MPTTVSSMAGKDEAGALRIEFPGYSGGEPLEPISWDEFFQTFDEKHLTMLYQETTVSGQDSRFVKFVSRETATSNT